MDQAFYLVHSMASGASFAALDREAAAKFGRAARRAGVRRIIYLGGLADDADSLSTHLKSRVETGEVLRESGVPLVEFRASIVIGAGSLSFEMIQRVKRACPSSSSTARPFSWEEVGHMLMTFEGFTLEARARQGHHRANDSVRLRLRRREH